MPITFTGNYGQNFDGLASSGTANAWSNDGTLPGWHLFRQPSASPVAITSYNADTGAANSGTFLSYGSSGSGDRALGGLASGGAYFGSPASGSVAGWFALAMSNTTAAPITNLAIAFNGEQWRNGGNATAQTMVLEYGYGASFEQVATWTAPGGNFNWSSPVATATAVAVDGNNAGRAGNLGGTLNLSASPWAATTTLWLRWTEINDAGSDHGLAIDDLTITTAQAPAQPEVAIQAIVAQSGEFGVSASARISRTGSTADALTVPISLSSGAGLADNDDLTAPLPASVVIPAGSSSVDLAIEARDDALNEGTESLVIELAAPAGYAIAASGAQAQITLLDNDRISLISAVQGSGTTSPLLDQNVTLRAVVVADFQLSGELGGFFLQEETADWDSSTLSSEGLYVAYPLSGSNVDVQLGDRVLVSGGVSERFSQTILSSIQALTVEASGRLADTRRVDIPDLLTQRSTSLDLEPYEGMWVRFPETLSVNGLFGQFRFGEVELSAGGLPVQPTNVMEPGAAAYAAEQATALRELVLDDGSNSTYRPASAATVAAPVRDQLLRRGDTIGAVEGVLAYDFSKYRLHPTAPLGFASENPRPEAPAAPAAGQLRLASFNVLNTFTTLNSGGALTDSGLAPRGANTAEELERQLSKLTTALLGLKADVIGLMELENDADDATLKTIVDRLNAALPADSGRAYSYVPTGLIGSDAIKVGLIYNNLAVATNGAARVLDITAFTDPLASGTPKNRPALAQTFRELASGETVNVVVNHLRSKGATDATGADLDQRDGQSAFNATRTAAAARLLEWIKSDPTGNADPDWVVLGDLNAYAKEDPIQVFEAAGYRNALPSFTAEPPSSYAFFTPVDMSGALDHLLISPSLMPQATAARDWSINAAEGAFRDYNRDANSNGNAAVRDFSAPDPYRTSDHDPVLLDLKLGRALPSGLGFSHGVASGDPYADSVILWTRVTPPAGFSGLLDVHWEVSRSADFEPGSIIDAGVFATSAARDWSVKVEADGLNADTTYYYRFRIGDVESMVGQTKTLPVGGDPVRLAVFSCANFTAAEQFAAYGRAAAINAVNPYDALVHLGDYIYEYGPGGYEAAQDAATDRGFLPNREIISLDDYRQRYAQYHTDQNLQVLRAAAPLIAIWDDHETANDSWSGGAQNHQSATEGDWLERRDAALKAYYEWLPIRDPDQRQASDGATALSPLSQGYRSFNFGEVLALHVLETRLTARDEQLDYPDAAAVQARIGAILTNPTELVAYAGKLGLTPPTTPQAIPAFAAALAPAVTQELVLATVQQAWGDPSRDLIGDTQLAWLQKQMAGSNAAWQVLGQQVLMQSMAVPAELLLNAGDPSLLDKYAAPLQKLATGTAFAELSAAEQALFSEAGKIPYNLDAWDGYGVERETILQTALAQGKRLISLAGDTHNAWAGVLDTMAPGTKPAGTVAGVEFATPGVTSPGLEKYLPGADAYIRAKYPAVDGLDGLFSGYVNGLKYADLNRRGFLDLTVNKDQAVGTFQFLDGVNPVSGLPQWASEAVVASSGLSLSLNPEATPLINWQPGWRELDLVFGMAVDATGAQTQLNPAAYATLPRAGVQLADVSVLGSQNTDRIFAGVGSLVNGAGGDDTLFNTDSQGDNKLLGGIGTDQFFLRPVHDQVIGGLLFSDAATFGLSPFTALVDRERDSFLIDSSDPGNTGSLQIVDYEPGIDRLLIDGVTPTGDWTAVRQQLQGLNVVLNAAPELSAIPVVISVKSGVEIIQNLGSYGTDLDGDSLQLLKLSGPDWISTSGTVLKATVPANLTEELLASTPLLLGFSDGKAVSSFAAQLTLNGAPTALSLANTTLSLAENSSTASRIKVAEIVIVDDNLGSNIISLSGPDAASFEVVGNALFLKSGTVLDFEAKTSYAVKVRVADPALPGSNPLTSDYSLAILDVNEAPTALTSSAASFAENITSGSTVAILTTTDPDASNTFTYSLVSGTGDTDNSAFAINGDKLNINASPNFEAKSSYNVRLRSTDQGGLSVERAVTFAVNDLNEAATALSLANTTLSLAENTSTASRIKVAEIVIVDDNLGSNIISLSGPDAASFEVVGNALFLKSGTVLDFEAKTSYAVKVRVADPALPGSNPLTSDYSLAILDVNEAPTALTSSASSFAENITSGSTVAILTTTDPDTSNTFTYSLVSGTGDTDNSAFTINGGKLNINASPNFEAKNSYSLRLRSTDQGGLSVERAITFAVNDLNEAPTALSLENTTPSLAENTSTASRIKVTDIVIADDNLGSNIISLSGTDAASFEVVGTSLFLKAGTVLNFEAKTSYAVTLSASDPSLPGSTPVSAAFSLAVSDLNEAPTALATSASSFAENITAGSTVAILTTTDPDASNTFTYSLVSGTGDTDNSAFTINGDKLNINASPNFEAKSSYSLRLRSTDQGGLSVERAVTFAVNDLNEAATALSLANTTPSLAENTSTASRIKVTDIVIADDNLGSNVISLSGTDAASFEVVGTSLFLKAGTVLDFEAKTSYAVKVRVADPALPGSNPLTSDYSLAISDVNEALGVKGVTTVVKVTLPNGDVKPITVSIDNGDLAPGTNLSVISNLGINPAGLTTLAELGVTINQSGLDFQLRVDPGARASLNALLDLVAADLLPQLTNPTGARRADRKLLYYAVNTAGAISPLTYDPITGAGARFYDLDNNGTADFFALSLIDGSYGDKDGLVNGVIDDPSVAGFTDLTNLRFSNAGSGTVTISDPTNAAPASVNLRATLSNRASSSNQIGYVVLNPSEVANSAALLADLSWLRGRSRTLYSSLENTDVTIPASSSFDRDLQLINGQSIRFFEVLDASLDQITSLTDSRFRLFTSGDFANGQVAFSSNSGVRFSLNLLPSDPGLNALISQAQGLAPVLDLSAFTTDQNLSGTVALAREAHFNSVAGFYRTLDAAGTVLAADAITRLRPGDSGYTAAALRTPNLVGQLGSLSVADNQSATRSFSGVTGGTFLAPFAQVNGNTFFAFSGASTDGLSHFRSLGNNLFGLEDVVGGGDRDYDDMIIKLNFSSVV